MIIYFSKKIRFSVYVFFIFSTAGMAQNTFFEPEVDLKWDPSGRWTYYFTFSNRDLIYKDENVKFDIQHVELTPFVTYEVGFYNKLGLGVRYRFRELFEDSSQDEIRIIEQFSHERDFNRIVLAYRIRLEERFRENTTFRSRYRLSGEFPLNGDRVDRNEFFMVAETEALWSLGKFEKPSLEQRIGISLGNKIFKNTTGELGVEYRLEDYTGDTSKSWFISSSISISI